MQTESFGARLREQRERQEVTLAAIADQTKIKLSHLEGLERGDLSHWPEGIFRRSWVRAYAKAIGLEPDTVVREFLEVYPDPVEVVPADAAERQSTRLRYLLGSAVGALSSIRQRYDHRQESAAARATSAERVQPLQRDLQPLEHELSTEPGPPVQRDLHPLEHDLSAFANLCTRLVCAREPEQVPPILEEAARILDAAGLIVWIWDPGAAVLKAVIGQGYSDQVLAQLPCVGRATDNAIAMAFRSGETRVVNGSEAATGAVVVPLMTPDQCVGVLALELEHGGEQREAVRAFSIILAAQLATLVSPAAVGESGYDQVAPVPGVDDARGTPARLRAQR